MSGRSETPRASEQEEANERGFVTRMMGGNGNRLNGGGQKDNGRGRFMREDLPEAYQQVQGVLEELPEKTLKWLERNESLQGLKNVERNLRRAIPASGRSFAKHLHVLAARIREAGEQFDQKKPSERLARRVEKIAGRLHRALQPSWRTRMKRAVRDHPVFSAGAVLLVGYGLYRALRARWADRTVEEE